MTYIRPIISVHVYPSTFKMALRGLLFIILCMIVMVAACAITTALQETL